MEWIYLVILVSTQFVVVLLVIYNLSPRLCMKRNYMMLSRMISGPRQLGNDVDVYLCLLIEDLKLLWDEEIEHLKP